MKPRSDSTLKTLPEERQREVFEYLRSHSLAETRAWLAQDGIKTSSAALSVWRSWWATQEALRRAEANADAFTEQLKVISPELDEAKLEAAGSILFQTLAIQEGDPKLWLAFRSARHRAEMDKAKLALAERTFGLEREKFEFDAAEACLAKLPELKAISEDNSLDEDAKLQRVRERLFGPAVGAAHGTPAVGEKENGTEGTKGTEGREAA